MGKRKLNRKAERTASFKIYTHLFFPIISQPLPISQQLPLERQRVLGIREE